MLYQNKECGALVYHLEKQNMENYYHSQRNNAINPYGACNITCLNMVFDYLQINYTDDEVMEMTRTPQIEAYYRSKLIKIFGNSFLRDRKLNVIWKVLEEVANEVFMQKKLPYRARFISKVENLSNYIKDTRIPIMLSTTFTRSGHIILLTGYVEKSSVITHYITNDPYGNPMTGYKDHNGRMVRIPRDTLAKKLNYDRGMIFEKMT